MSKVKKNKLDARSFGAALRTAYTRMLNDTTTQLERESANGIEWPSSLTAEVGALLYFAFDFAMSAGPEASLRDRIRDGFIASSPFPKEVALFLADRADEYSAAMRSASNDENRLLQIGDVFASHTGHHRDIAVIMQAVISYTAASSFTQEQVANSISDLI